MLEVEKRGGRTARVQPRTRSGKDGRRGALVKGTPRSHEYRLGMLDVLRFRLSAVPIPERYEPGSVQFDVRRGSESVTQHEKVNVEIAQGILLDIEAHGGPGSGLVLWAALLISDSKTMRPDPVGAAEVTQDRIRGRLSRAVTRGIVPFIVAGAVSLRLVLMRPR